MSARPLLIIQMGVPPRDVRDLYGEQAAWVRDALASGHPEIVVVQPERGDALPSPAALSGAIITGSWSMVTDREAWSEQVAAWIREAFESALPIFGICYGHQLMAHALGGQVAYLADGPELGTLPVRLHPLGAKDPALSAFPETFLAHLTHSQTVAALPEGAICLASSTRDAHQIVRYNDKSMSVQFHPEFTAALIRHCLARHRNASAQDGDTLQTGAASSPDTPYAHRLLLHFVASLA